MFQKPEMPTSLQRRSTSGPLPRTTETEERLCSRSDAADATRRLMACYRKADVADPQVFVTSIATVLMAYPPFVAHLAADPLKGIPSKVSWLPSIAEVKAFCDAVVAPERERKLTERLRAEQMARRALPAPDDVERRCATVERLQGRLGSGWGIKRNEDDVAKVLDDPEAALATVKPIVGIQLSDAAKDALKRRLESKS